MTATLPSFTSLQPNLAWASLPLFDRKGWKRVRFGDVVENCNETCDPAEAGLERFVAMEHLEPGSLHVRSWGNVADGTTFTRRCRPGQVLFGKRRAYQRKVAVAGFEAVVSGDIYVLAPKDTQRLLPELLPFLCLSERFFQHAVGTSAGSLSPRTNWSSLASFEFDLPPLDQQRRIAEILMEAWQTQTAYEANFQALTAFSLSSFGHIQRDKELPERWETVPLESLCSHIVDCLHSTPECCDEGYPVIRTADVVPGRMLVEHARRVSKETYDERVSRLLPEAGDIFYSREGARFGIAAPVPPNVEVCLGQRMMHFRANTGTDPSYLLWLINSPIVRSQAVAGVIGSASPHVNIRDIKQFKVPKPPFEEQQKLGRLAVNIADAELRLTQHVEATSVLLSALSQTITA